MSQCRGSPSYQQPPEVFYKKGVPKNFSIFTRKDLCQSLFLSCNFIKKETLAQGFFCEFCKIFKNTFFTEHLWMTASILQQFLALYFAILYSWQLWNSEKSFVGKKLIYLKDFTDLEFFFYLPCRLRKAYAVLWAANRFVGSEKPKHNDFDQF